MIGVFSSDVAAKVDEIRKTQGVELAELAGLRARVDHLADLVAQLAQQFDALRASVENLHAVAQSGATIQPSEEDMVFARAPARRAMGLE